MAKSPEQIAQAWAAVTLEKFQRNLKAQKIGASGALAGSFQDFVRAEAGGDLLRVRLLYLYYGAFVDMGVGRGQKLGQASDNAYAKQLLGKKGRRRRAKKWYSKTIAAEQYTLARIMQAYYGQRMATTLTANLVKEIQISF